MARQAPDNNRHLSSKLSEMQGKRKHWFRALLKFSQENSIKFPGLVGVFLSLLIPPSCVCSVFNPLGSWFYTPRRHASVFIKLGTCLQLSSFLHCFPSIEVWGFSSFLLIFFLSFSFQSKLADFLLIWNSQEAGGLCVDLSRDHSIGAKLFHKSFFNNPFPTFGFY